MLRLCTDELDIDFVGTLTCDEEELPDPSYVIQYPPMRGGEGNYGGELGMAVVDILIRSCEAILFFTSIGLRGDNDGTWTRKAANRPAVRTMFHNMTSSNASYTTLSNCLALLRIMWSLPDATPLPVMSLAPLYYWILPLNLL